MLNSSATLYQLPLTAIALIDMNAFFAQCEQHRLGKTLQDPVVCCQWQSLIAVSYAARKFGIGRMDTLKLAKDKCPGLIVGHAAVFKKGESHWLYLDGPPDQSIHKVSLDPYRRELRKIVKILKREVDLVERASVDESYLDLGRLLHAKLQELFPFLAEPGPDDDSLPEIPTTFPPELKWEGEIYPTPEEEATQKQTLATNEKMEATQIITLVPANLERLPLIADWDDVVMLVGSQLLYKFRQAIFTELGYTTSGGLATTKTVAKLAGGFIKPDLQTIIRPDALNNFLNNFELTDITTMGGKLGEVILQKLDVPQGVNSNAYIRDNYTVEQIRKQLPEPQLAEKIHLFVRGLNHQELRLRTDVKLMMSRKNFQLKRPVKTLADAFDWIRVYVGDLYGRLIELDDENLNLLLLQKSQGDKEFIYRPRTVSLQMTTTSWSKFSKQGPIPVIKNLDKFRLVLESAGFRLLCELMENSKAADLNPGVKFRDLKPSSPDLDKLAIPSLANMGLVVSNFVKTSDANLIDSYGGSTVGSTQENIRKLFEDAKEEPKVDKEPVPEPKVTRSDSYIQKLFRDFENEQTATKTEKKEEPKKGVFKEDKEYVKKMFDQYQRQNSPVEVPDTVDSRESKLRSKLASKETTPVPEDPLLKELIRNRFCSKCNVAVEDVFEHKDYHMALDLSLKLNGQGKFKVASPKRAKTALVSPKKRQKKGKPDKGQSKLPF